jgi:hypothetical protein
MNVDWIKLAQNWVNSSGLHGPGTGPRVSYRPGPRVGPGPRNIEKVWVQAGFEPSSNDRNPTLYRILWVILFAKKKVVAGLTLCS